MTISNEECNPKVYTNYQPAGLSTFLKFLGLHPSTEMTITPTFFEQVQNTRGTCPKNFKVEFL